MKEWYLKVTDGSVFGPANTASLTEWAREGRILPGDSISEDKEHWIPAEQLPDLKMVWIVELKNGSYHGPVNIGAIAIFLSEKTILPNAKLINQQTNKHTTVAVHCPELVSAPDTKTDSSVEATNKLKDQISALNKELGSTRTHLENARLETQERASLLKLEKERNKKNESRQSAQVDRLEREKKISADRIKKADISIRELKQKQQGRVDWMGSKEPEKPKISIPSQIETAKREAELLHRIEALEADSHVVESKLAKTEKSLKSQIRDYDNLKVRSKRKQTEQEEDIKRLKGETADADKNITKLKSVLVDERARSDEFRKQIKTGEATLATEQTKHKESREDAQKKQADLAAQVDKFKTACGELAIQIRTIRETSQQTESKQKKAINALTEEKDKASANETHLINTISNLHEDLDTSKSTIQSLTAKLEKEREQNAVKEEELLQNVEEMKNKLESESVVPEILPPHSRENRPNSNNHSEHLENLEEQAQRELHKWQQQQGEKGKSGASMFSSWKKK